MIHTGASHDNSLTIHPGLVWNVGHHVGVGMRAAFDVNSSTYGFTPLVNKSWPIKSEGSFFKAYFVEAVMPVRFNRPTVGPQTTPVTFAMHFGDFSNAIHLVDLLRIELNRKLLLQCEHEVEMLDRIPAFDGLIGGFWRDLGNRNLQNVGSNGADPLEHWGRHL